ncbi:MAG: A/G-specific adenine glycosylase [Dysgonamonadaceae bacterium]|nr:A/G-specific adenine glycosylase [Dysgonamonadaceae bacterium]
MNEDKESVVCPGVYAGFVSDGLIAWYRENKRDLPWRNTGDPYKIWISEIILQQTRVDQGLDYYSRFVSRFPDVFELAGAEEDEVLKYWQGLGYYSRARNLHASAKMIVEEYNGKFPEKYEDILHLKGVGEYTAAAIISFAWNRPYPTVDGNVFRFLSRLLAIEVPIDTGTGKKLFTETAGILMDEKQPGLFNQAMMEFGALQCVPVSPDCNNCPFVFKCMAYIARSVNLLPVKQGKTKVEDRYLYYFHIKQGGETYLEKRKGKGVWYNLYEFPVIESGSPLEFMELRMHPRFQEIFGDIKEPKFRLVLENKKHILSHRRLFASFYEVTVDADFLCQTLSGASDSLIRIPENTIDTYPTHRLMEIYLEGSFYS